jgi:hypothetical protein
VSLKLGVAISSLMVLCACAQAPANPDVIAAPAIPTVEYKTNVVDTGCNWTKAILPSTKDVLTDGTADQILAHNLAGAKHCGWKPPK